MSRIDEALRRAAEAAAGGRPAAPTQPATLPHDNFSHDSYPVEPREVRQPEARPAMPATPQPASPPAPSSPVFAELSLDSLGDGLARKVVVDRDMAPASREQYRRLAATLHQAQSTNGLKVVMVVSAAASEGKTLTAANLALTLSESYHRKVLLIDGDLRRPALDTLFRIDGAPGLHEGLTSHAEQMISLRQITPRLLVLPAGEATSDPIAGLTGDRMRRLIDEARGSFDWVIVDTPPVGLLPDANLLASMADGAVMVVRAESTPYDLVQRAIDALGRDRILGVVLNRASDSGAGYYNYNRYYSTPRPSGALYS
jgi:capsular exopolysaccharide synthesis family protein